ncbi:MFS transporter [Lysobacteraceae bacterium NML93-0792]|nr:MFS transporter [Xanthomonadaceae bacterium NML93-0792]PBS17419.1 MFS transporter [Xanthomonadaceae bacterium NML93-0793]PBS20618.1 MFS transporter [Xanthomonadaceae bacterium NML93-0831]
MPRRTAGWILSVLALGGFAIGTSEFAMMGLMPELVRAFGVSEPQVGHMISSYALGVVVGAPLLAVLGASWPRRSLLIALMGFYALGNLATALAPTYPTMLIARFVAGLPHGAYFGVAMLVAASISAPGQRGAAVSRVLLGLSIAILVGNPLATWLGQLSSWRWTFALVAGLALVTAACVWRLLAATPADAAQTPMRELRAFNRAQVWYALAIGAVGFAGMFCVFSYLAPTLIHVTGVAERWIPIALAAFGVGAIGGNLAGGWLFDRLQFRAVAVILGWSLGVLLLFPLAAQTPWSILPAIVALGTMGALAPVLQARLMDVAGDAQTLAAASNHAAFNTANALGPWLGGLAIGAGLGWTATGYVGAATAAAGLAIYLHARRDARRARMVDAAC